MFSPDTLSVAVRYCGSEIMLLTISQALQISFTRAAQSAAVPSAEVQLRPLSRFNTERRAYQSPALRGLAGHRTCKTDPIGIGDAHLDDAVDGAVHAVEDALRRCTPVKATSLTESLTHAMIGSWPR
jgi:hypothetical protein